MTIAILIFTILIIGISIYDFITVKNFQDFACAGKSQRFFPVYFSLMASMIGASATMGINDKVIAIGFPAFWWLAVGAIGLVAQSFFLSEKIRSLNSATLPEIAKITIGKKGAVLLAIIIPIAWTGIVAAQILSIAKILHPLLESINEKSLVIIVGIFVIFYTMLGGQKSILKTDSIQALIIFLGITLTFFYLYFVKSENNIEIFNNIDLLNKKFHWKELIVLLFITGGTYFLGPDIISRNLISKDKSTAKKATFAAGFTLIFFSTVITLIGMWAVKNIDPLQLAGSNPLVYIMNNIIPNPLAILLCLALTATLLSSADTCLMNAATILEQDLLQKNKIWQLRIIVVFLGSLALIIATCHTDIIDLLMAAYSIYAPGIVFPLTIAILCYGKKKIRKNIIYMALILGSTLGILNTYFSIGGTMLPLIAMALSLILSLIAIRN